MSSNTEETQTRLEALQAFQALRAEAKANGVSDLSLEEINEEIRKARLIEKA